MSLSELQSEACRDPSAWELEMVWDCFSVAPSGPLHLSLKRMWIVNHTPVHERSPWTGEDKLGPPHPSPICFLQNAFLLRLVCVVVCHLVLCWWNAIVLWNRERWGDYHGLFVMVGMGGWKRRMIGCFQKWFVWKTTEAACTWDSKPVQQSKKRTTLMQPKIND